MNKEIDRKLIQTALDKIAKVPDELLIYLVVVNKHTGKAEITEFPTLESVESPPNC